MPAARRRSCFENHLIHRVTSRAKCTKGLLMKPQNIVFLRGSIVIFAGILAVQAAWLLAVDYVRPTLPYFPQDKVGEQEALAARSFAVTAASIGWIRGELWTDAAIALSTGLTSATAEEHDAQMLPQRNQARAAAQRAVRLSPHDSRAWLLLAALDSRFDWPDDDANRLKMSYFTGPNEFDLAPMRIRIAVHSSPIGDAELQSLVKQDIRSIVLRHQEQKSSLLAAYRDASPEGKEFLEATIGDVDKDFLATLRASDSRQ